LLRRTINTIRTEKMSMVKLHLRNKKIGKTGFLHHCLPKSYSKYYSNIYLNDGRIDSGLADVLNRNLNHGPDLCLNESSTVTLLPGQLKYNPGHS